MNLKKSIVVLSLIAVFVILMAVFAVVSFPIAGTVYDYNGYAKTIKLGLDMSGGISAEFTVNDDGYGDLETRVDGTVVSLQDLLVSKGYTESTVTWSRKWTGHRHIPPHRPGRYSFRRCSYSTHAPASAPCGTGGNP